MAQTILFVDDDSGLQRVILRGGGDAKVIVLDLRMPVMDGWSFRKEQRSDPGLAGIPVIVLSGADAERVPEIEAAAAFRKPVSFSDVIAVVRRLCGVSPH